MKFRIDLICGARPNFMKIAPLYGRLKESDLFEPRVIHTGQHFDPSLSDSIWSDLGLGEPDEHFGVGNLPPAEQIAAIISKYEKRCRSSKRPDLCIVPGDVNSSVAVALAANKSQVKVAHLEAGLRSYDRKMPEESNRVLIDHLSDYHWAPSIDAVENLAKEKISGAGVINVGNIMVDSLERLRSYWEGIRPDILGKFGLVTLHRPSNVDDPGRLELVLTELSKISECYPLVFPVHPRTEKTLQGILRRGFSRNLSQIKLIAPLSYLNFVAHESAAHFIITDSGGVQEESTHLKVRCYTLRENTERPITLSHGTNSLVPQIETLSDHVLKTCNESVTQKPSIDYWDGKTAERIITILEALTESF